MRVRLQYCNRYYFRESVPPNTQRNLATRSGRHGSIYEDQSTIDLQELGRIQEQDGSLVSPHQDLRGSPLSIPVAATPSRHQKLDDLSNPAMMSGRVGKPARGTAPRGDINLYPDSRREEDGERGSGRIEIGLVASVINLIEI
jgi:hypothetical protein